MSRETSSVIFPSRSAVAALAAASVVSVGIYGVYAWDWNLEAVTYLAIPVCVAIGVIGLHSHHGLKSEKWLPLMLKDRARSGISSMLADADF